MEMRQQGRVYTFLGILLLGAILYVNFYGVFPSLHLHLPLPWLQPHMPFVLRNSTHFLLSDSAGTRPLYVNGWNSYWMLAAASSPSSMARVPEMLRRARGMGMTVCRTWAFSDGGPNALQTFPGHFDEGVFQALDYVVYEARKNGVWLILSLVNNLNAYGGKQQYVQWAREAGVNVSSSGHDDFFSNPTIKGYYKDYVKNIITRKNSYSGIRYFEDPAIFAWELINEPRCVSNSSAPLLQAWIAEMAAYVKSLDAKHLVTVGLEGFYGPGRSNRLGVNPGEWAASLGSDFIQNSATEHIDFASVHAYPDNWIPKASFEEKARYLANWVDTHLNDSENVLKKPVIFTEVGSYLHTKKKGLYHRDILLKIIYDKIYESAKRGGAGAGAFIWQLMVEGMQRESDAFSLVAREHPATRSLIIKQSCRLNNLSRTNKTNGEDGFPCDGIE